MKLLFVIFIFSLSFNSISCQGQSLSCNSQTSCASCVQTVKCAWCSATGYDRPRCDFAGSSFQEECANVGTIQDYHRPQGSVRSENNFADGNSTERNQVNPQKVHLNLPLGVTQDADLVFFSRENYPVDLYILLDMSVSMARVQRSLIALAGNIAESMALITSDFRLGYGEVIEKPMSPYFRQIRNSESEDWRFVDSQCGSNLTTCSDGFSFRHRLSVQPDSERFKEAVEKSILAKNNDALEATLEAIMQVIVCKEEIGWRPSSRKILLVATDEGFHVAGDGKLAGILRRNDGLCHLDSMGRYDAATDQDYPSLAEVAKEALANNINIMFVTYPQILKGSVSERQITFYKKVSELLEGAVQVTLYRPQDESDVSSPLPVVELIRNNYKAIQSKVQLLVTAEDPASINYVDFKFFSSCGSDGEAVETSGCDGVGVGQSVVFHISATAKICPVDNDRKYTYFISPQGLDDVMTVFVSFDCRCTCEKFAVSKSPTCKGRGTEVCGRCTNCTDNYYGKACECDETKNKEDDCKSSKDTSILCGGLGECVCGYCQCEWGRGGDFCECDRLQCRQGAQEFCNGNGKCDCETCICNSPYTGKFCECYNATDTCIRPGSKDICGGQGDCICGKCRNCQKGHDGPFCDDCQTCTQQCAVEEACARCKANKGGPKANSCDLDCSHVVVVDGAVPVSAPWRACSFKDAEGCLYSFAYNYVVSSSGIAPRVYVSTKELCPRPINIVAVVLGIVGAVLLVGIIILIAWKLYTELARRREAAQLENEKETAEFSEFKNPYYSPPTVVVKNPVYEG